MSRQFLENLLHHLIREGSCPSCRRKLKWATLTKACQMCYGWYIYENILRIDVDLP